MNVVLWVVQVLARVMFIAVGAMKAFRAEQAAQSGMKWVSDVCSRPIIATNVH